MKYQIYLNKDTSDFINLASEQEGIKPATLIKQIVESITSITKATQEATRQALYRPKEEDKNNG